MCGEPGLFTIRQAVIVTVGVLGTGRGRGWNQKCFILYKKIQEKYNFNKQRFTACGDCGEEWGEMVDTGKN